ncbi:MAG TPA: hypothetical protein VFJ05_00860 [Nitrososphaeraceae archaeon]|nr:hypothetical protein [Nitrososphaeraceae archaeon]
MIKKQKINDVTKLLLPTILILSIGSIHFGSNSAKAAVAGSGMQVTDVTKEAQGIVNSVKAALAYYGLSTGAYTEANEVGPFFNTSSLQKTGNATTTSSNISNVGNYEIAHGLATAAQERFIKSIPPANDASAAQKVIQALAGLISFKNAVDSKAPYNLVEDQATHAIASLEQAFNLK